MEEDFFELIGADRDEIRLLHAVIWLSLTTYAWQDYDSVSGHFIMAYIIWKRFYHKGVVDGKEELDEREDDVIHACKNVDF